MINNLLLFLLSCVKNFEEKSKNSFCRKNPSNTKIYYLENFRKIDQLQDIKTPLIFNLISILGYFSTLCSNYFCNFWKKGPRPKWTIYKHISDNSKKCLSVGSFEILSVVVICRLYVARLQPTPAYVEA